MFAGIDVGGTKVLCVILNEEGKNVGECKVKVGTEKTVESVLAKVHEAYAGALKAANVSECVGVGLAVPGPVDSERRRVLRAVNLGWHQETDLSSVAESMAGKPFLWLENDANMGAFGEATQGAGKGTHSCYAVFVGTGLGAGYLLGGELVTGANGNCGEIGHTVMDLRSKKAQQCNCGKRGCLETIASKSGLLGWLRLQVQPGTPDAETLDVAAPNWRTEMVGAKSLKKAAKSSPLTKKALSRAADALGAAAANVLTTTGCERVIIGGGLVEELGDSLWEKVIEGVKAHSFAGETHAPLVVKTQLGDAAVAVGAAAFCKKKYAEKKNK